MQNSLIFGVRWGVSVVLIGVLTACELFTGPDLHQKISQDVARATAKELVLTIGDDPNATETPSGSQKMKEGYGVDLEAIADSRYVVLGWRQTAGEGTVSYTKVSATKVHVEISGGPVTITPVVEQRPEILFGLPVGGNSTLSLNSSFTVVFNREVDFASAIQAIKLLRLGTTEVAGTLTFLGGTGTMFKPAANLDGNTNYSLRISSLLLAAIDTSLPQYAGLFVMNSKVAYVPQQDREFFTSAQVDSSPPTSTTFGMTLPGGDAVYTASQQITLTNIQGLDDSGVAGVLPLVQATDPTADPSADDIGWRPYIFGMSLTVDANMVAGKNYAYLFFKDANDKVMSYTSVGSSKKTIIFDNTAPKNYGFAIQTPLTPGFVGSTSVTLGLNFTDPDVGVVKGSGQSADGTVDVERKLMSFSNAYSATDFQTTEAYAATKAWTLAAGADGTRTVTTRVADALGNMTEATSSVKLDTTAPSFLSVPKIANAAENINGGSSRLTTVPISLDYTDFNAAIGENGSGVAQIRIAGGAGVASGSAYSFVDGNGTTPGSGTLTGTASPWVNVSAMGFGTMNLVLTAGEGSKPVTFEVKDKVGNVGSITATFNLDTTVPTGGSITLDNGNSSTNRALVTIQVTHPSDPVSGGVNSGYSGVWFSNTNSAPTSASAGWQALTNAMANPASYANWALPGVSGTTYTVYAWFRDAAGNVSGPVQDSILYSNTPSPGNASLSSTIYSTSGTIAVTLNTTGASAASDAIRFSNDGLSWQTMSAASISGNSYNFNVISGYGGSNTNGARTIWVRIYSTASAFSESILSYTLDNIAPAVSSFAILGGVNYTTLGQGNINLSVADVTSPSGVQMRLSNDNGITWTSWLDYAPTVSFNWTSGYGATSSEGTKTVRAEFRDGMGNVSTISDSIVYDFTAPSLPSIQLDASSGFTNNTAGTISITFVGASDAGSGLAQMQFSNDNNSWSTPEPYSATKTNWSIISGYGANSTQSLKTVYARIIDGAGYVSATVSASTTWDITTPSINIFRLVDSSNSNTTLRQVNLYLVPNTGDLSGVTDVQFSDTTTGDGPWLPRSTNVISSPKWILPVGNGTKSVKARIRDAAGNVSAWLSDSTVLTETTSALTLGEIAAVYNSPGSLAAPYMVTNLTVTDRLTFFRTSAGNYGYLTFSVPFATSSPQTTTLTYKTFKPDGTKLQGGTWTVGGYTAFDFDTGSIGSGASSDVQKTATGLTFPYGAYNW